MNAFSSFLITLMKEKNKLTIILFKSIIKPIGLIGKEAINKLSDSRIAVLALVARGKMLI